MQFYISNNEVVWKLNIQIQYPKRKPNQDPTPKEDLVKSRTEENQDQDPKPKEDQLNPEPKKTNTKVQNLAKVTNPEQERKN